MASEAKKRERMESRVVIPENEKGCGGGRGNLMTFFLLERRGAEGARRGNGRGEVLSELKRKERVAREGTRRSANLNLEI